MIPPFVPQSPADSTFRRLASSILLVLGLAALAGCAAVGTAPPASGYSLRVLAVETFLADIAQNVAGDRVTVEALLPIGVDPHAFEPTPTDLRTLVASDVIVVNGAGAEGFMSRLLAQAGGNRTVITASDGLASRTAREGETAQMTDAEVVDAMCSGATASQPQTGSGREVASAVTLPDVPGLREVTLVSEEIGRFGGYLRLQLTEGGDWQFAAGGAEINLSSDREATWIPWARRATLRCAGLDRGYVAGLVPGSYLIHLTGSNSQTIRLLAGPLGAERHDQDPHFWMDPVSVIRYVLNIRDGLTQVDRGGAAIYAANAEKYIARLIELDAWVRDQVKAIPPERRLLVTNHESLGYFADRYGFSVVGTIVPAVSSDASPSAQQLARLTERVRAAGAKAIFLETGANPQLARQLALETGIKVVTELYTHSITEEKGRAPTYIEMIRYDARAIVDALE